jgi:hypothetical protein
MSSHHGGTCSSSTQYVTRDAERNNVDNFATLSVAFKCLSATMVR